MKSYDVTLIRGDGIGPEVAASAKTVLDATGVKFNWHEFDAGAAVAEKTGEPLPMEVIESVKKDGLALKGPVTTPLGSGFRSVNVALRKALDLYANVRPAANLPGVPSRYSGVDIVTVRENTEDLYAGIEHSIGDVAAESIKLITKKGCERILRYAFEYAQSNGRKRVTAVHKANIMKLTDGMFLSLARDMAREYPSLEFEDVIIDALCMRLVQEPEHFDVLVAPNLYGDIVSDLCAGLVGGLGVAPSANVGKDCAVFEAVHGSAPQLAGKNAANPLALILSGELMLRHIGEKDAADRLHSAVLALLGEGRATCDLGGTLGTEEFTLELCERLNGAQR